MLKASSSTPTVDTDKPVHDQMTSESDDHQTQDAENDEHEQLSFEEE